MIGAVEYWYNDQSFTASREALYRAIGQYARRHSYIYIGLTQQQPEARFRQHQLKWAPGHEWHRMIVIYKSRTFSLMQRVEDDLIAYARRKVDQGRYLCQVLNDRDSQPPARKPDATAFWVYILVQA